MTPAKTHHHRALPPLLVLLVVWVLLAQFCAVVRHPERTLLERLTVDTMLFKQ